MTNDTRPPLFIVGAPRSGTSLLRNLVRACKGVYMPPDETQFFPAYFEKAAGQSTSSSLASFVDGTAFSTHMRDRGIWPSQEELLEIFKDPAPELAIPKLMRYLAKGEQQASFALWGDKTPKYIYFLDVFRKAFPGMRVLFVVRDPRDAVLSMREAWGRSLIRGATAWSDAARIALTEANDQAASDVMVVHYEELALDPKPVMARVADWLDVEFSAEAIDNYSGEEEWGAVDNEGVVNTSVGRYSAVLSNAEVELIESTVFGEMNLLGYSPTIATREISPGRIRLHCARIGDGVRSLAKYGKERGLVGGIGYKIRQFLTTRDGGGT
jgi:hypothetical protein